MSTNGLSFITPVPVPGDQSIHDRIMRIFDIVVAGVHDSPALMAGYTLQDSLTVILWILTITFVATIIFISVCTSYFCIMAGLKKRSNVTKGKVFEDDYVYVKNKSDYHRIREDEAKRTTLPF